MPEVVKYLPVVGHPGYRVGTDGSVWSRVTPGYGEALRDKWTRLKPSPTAKGYLRVELPGKRIRFVHRIVLEAFVGPCPVGYMARHFPDNDRANNRVDNLSWTTAEQNCADKVIHGTDARGEKNNLAKLTETQVQEIRNLYKRVRSQRRIAVMYGMHQTTIGRILRNETWKCVG